MLTLPNHIDKADIDAFVAHVTSEVNEGVVDPLSVHIRCKAVIKALEAILELTEGLVDLLGQFAGGLSAGVFQGDPEVGVVDVAAGVVADGGADVGGKGLEILEEFLGGLFLYVS